MIEVVNFHCLEMPFTLLLWITCVYGVFPDNRTAVRHAHDKTLQNITLAVILPSEAPYMFRKQMVLPAIEYAVSSVAEKLARLGYRYEVSYRDSFCNKQQARIAAKAFYHENQKKPYRSDVRIFQLPATKANSNSSRLVPRNEYVWTNFSSYFFRIENPPMAFLGPACNAAAMGVLDLADMWTVPMITSGAPTIAVHPAELPTLVRIGPNHYDLAQFIWRIFNDLGHGLVYPIHLIYEDRWESGTAEDECLSVIKTLSTSLPVFDRRFHVFAPKSISGNFSGENLVKHLMEPRVVVMCASMVKIREIMIGAYKEGYAEPDANHWFVIDMHHRPEYASGAWKIGDERDSLAKEAFKALMVITLFAGRLRRFDHFREQMLRSYRKSGIKEDVNEFVIGFHDAVILHQTAIKATLKQGIDVRDGMAVARNMRRVMFQGIAGLVLVENHGDKRGEYSILAMTDYQAGTFSNVYDYVGTFLWRNGKLPKLNSTKIDLHRNYTICNKQRSWESILQFEKDVEELAEANESHEIIAGVLGTIGGMTLCCLLVFVPVCHQKRRRPKAQTISENGTALSGDYTTANPDQLCLHRPLRQETSVSTCMTTFDTEDCK